MVVFLVHPSSSHRELKLNLVVRLDGVWAYTGTGNFDSLGLRHNRELGLAVNAGPVVREIEERLFFPDLKPAWELTEPLPLSPIDYLYELAAVPA